MHNLRCPRLNEYLAAAECCRLSGATANSRGDNARGDIMSTMTGGDPKLMYPGLAHFYASWRDIADTVVRVIIGFILFMHGWVKLTVMGAAGVGGFMASHGLHPGVAFAYAAIFLETIGALCIIFGVFTRFFAAALAIEMLIAMLSVHWAHGFSSAKGGYEYVLLLGIVLFAIAIRGGGPYSVDRVIGKEL
jgi:putative oxidoreductase